MKKYALIFLLCASARPLFAQAPNETEIASIQNTIQAYFDGWATGDTTKLGSAMHYSCHLKNYREGKFIEYSRTEYLSFFKPRERIENLTTQIASLDMTDLIAAAKVEIITEKFVFTDYFNLMKMENKWFIVDKISTNKPNTSKSSGAVFPIKESILEGLNRPWSLAFVTEDTVLISEKEGELMKVDLVSKQKIKIKGFPTDMADSIGYFHAGDNTGKFEVLFHPNFSKNRYVYLSYAAQNERGRATKVVRAVLEGNSLQDIKAIFVAEPYIYDRYHYGGGMTFGPDGKLYITAGERVFNEKDEPELPFAQDTQDKRGKIYRLNSDGTIPKDNPDFGKNAVPGLFALGIRAAQGLTVEPGTGSIWFSEHGTVQGDEINILKAGANYGWPIKTTGKYRFAEYVPPTIEGNQYRDPVWSWSHTVAPTGLTFYSGNEFPAWNHNLLVAGLSRGSLWRFTVDGEEIKSAEELFTDDRVRLRKVVQSPEGKLYVLTDEVNGQLLRVKPGK